MQRKEFNYKGKKIVYRTKGAGPLLLLLHGFGEDGTVWKNQFDLFPRHQLIIPDLPGSGDSEMIDDMSMEGMADVMMALAAPLSSKAEVSSTKLLPVEETTNSTTSLKSGPSQLGKTPPSEGLGEAGLTLIGHSMGGYITLAFAEKYPHSLKAFGLFHSTAFADSEEKKATRQKGIKFMEEKGGFEFLKTAIPNLYSPRTKDKWAHLIEEHLNTVRNFSTEPLVSYYRAMMQRPDRTNVLRNSKVPVLFVLGKYDNAVPLEEGLTMCHLPQLSYIHVLQNSGHMGMIEQTDESNKILDEFISTIENLALT